MNDIPLFSVPELNAFSQYERFFRTSAYIRSASQRRAPDSPFRKKEKPAFCALREHLGYRKPEKFRMHRRQWEWLERPVPRRFLELIGASEEKLMRHLAADRALFDELLQLPLYPRVGIVRLMPTVYIPYRFQEETPENEAVELLAAYAREYRRNCAITYPELKTITIFPDGAVGTRFYPPRITWSRSWIYHGESGRGFATTRVV